MSDPNIAIHIWLAFFAIGVIAVMAAEFIAGIFVGILFVLLGIAAGIETFVLWLIRKIRRTP